MGGFMKTVEITCTTCGKKSQKRKAEIDHRTRLGKTKFYCNATCVGRDPEQHGHLLEYTDRYDISQHAGCRRDEFTDFKWYIKVIKQRKRDYDVDVQYLKELWESQQGICPLTGWKLILRKHITTRIERDKRQASLDCIDSSQGYIKGNVRFIAVIANYARNLFTDDDVIEFCEAVVNNRK